jgi:hypothetical protein
MEFALPDARIGRDFSKRIHDLLGIPVAFESSGSPSSFSLLVSFSRFRFRLSIEAVSTCLATILGGTSSNFAVQQLDEQIFRFEVSCTSGFSGPAIEVFCL